MKYCTEAFSDFDLVHAEYSKIFGSFARLESKGSVAGPYRFEVY